MAYSVLVVDDEALTLRTISRGLREEGFEVFVAATGEEGVRLFHEEHPDLTLLDIVLPGVDGVEVLRQIRRASPAAIVLMMSAYHMVDRAVEAMKLGAFDYLIKPFQLADMVNTLRRASEMLALRVQVRENVERAKGRYDFGLVVTQNEVTRKMLELARKAAEADHTTILIQGESGTGKGVLAKAIHYGSPRAAMPLLELNCAALPDTLLESELFGYEPGAFTDARRRKEGLLERANNGTLFLDEAATNANLKEAVAQGRFREDLFYRLNVVPLDIPPLRERREDIMSLALEMLKHFNRELKKKFTGFTPAAAEQLQQYPWPGNIRELKNVIERTMILAPEGDIDAASLPEEIRDHRQEIRAEPPSHFDVSPTGDQFPTLHELEDDYIQRVLAATGNNKTQAARILGIHPTSLLRRLKKDHAAD
jgi:two-component system response regulator AtoC